MGSPTPGWLEKDEEVPSLKLTIALKNWGLEDDIFFWDGLFPKAMLVSGRVSFFIGRSQAKTAFSTTSSTTWYDTIPQGKQQVLRFRLMASLLLQASGTNHHWKHANAGDVKTQRKRMNNNGYNVAQERVCYMDGFQMITP